MAGWRVVAVCSIAGFLAGTGSALAQAAQPSLAEVARQEAERRKAVASAGKVYTNDDTKTGRPLTTGSASLAKAAAAAKEKAAETSGEVQAEGQPSKDGKATGKGEVAKEAREALLKRILDTRAQISKNGVDAGKIQAQIQDLNSSVLNSFDSVERAQFVTQRDGALENYRKLESDTETLRKVLSDLEAEVAKAGKGTN